MNSMDSLVKTTTILALMILGTQGVKPYPKVPSSSSGVNKTSGRSIGVSENAAAVSADGFLEIAARIDIHSLLALLQQIPFLREAVLQLVEEVKTLKDKDCLAGIKEELGYWKTDVTHKFDEVQSNIQNVLERSNEESLKSVEKILESALGKRDNSFDICTGSLLQEATAHITNIIIQTNKDMMKMLMNQQEGSELSKITTTVEHNAKLLNDIGDLIHDGRSSSPVNCDGLSPAEEQIKTEIATTQNLMNIAYNHISNLIETSESTSRAFYEQRLGNLEKLVTQALEDISSVGNLTQNMADKEDQYFQSAVSETTEIVQVVKKTHHFVKRQAESTANAAARLEKAAARTLSVGRSFNCERKKTSSKP